MNEYFAIAVYRCLIAGRPDNSLDVQVRYFTARTEEEVRDHLNAEERDSYLNDDGETVEWELRRIMDVDEIARLESGDEVAGFIARADEFAELAARGDEEKR